MIDIAQDFAEGKRAAAATHEGDHAEGTTVVATVLHLEIGTSLLVIRIEDRGGEQFGVSKNVFHHNRRALTNRQGRRGVDRRAWAGNHRPENYWQRIIDQGAQRDEAVSGGDLSQTMLVRVADDERNAVEGGDLLRGTLRIAAGNNDSGSGIRAMDAPDRRPCILIRGRGDGAGVQDDDFGFGRRAGPRQSPLG